MNLYLRAKHAPVPCEVDADALRYWLDRALKFAPQTGTSLSPFLPKNGRAGIIDTATAQRLVKVISAFAMDENDEGDDAQIAAAEKLFQACRNPPLTVSKK